MPAKLWNQGLYTLTQYADTRAIEHFFLHKAVAGAYEHLHRDLLNAGLARLIREGSLAQIAQVLSKSCGDGSFQVALSYENLFAAAAAAFTGGGSGDKDASTLLAALNSHKPWATALQTRLREGPATGTEEVAVRVYGIGNGGKPVPPTRSAGNTPALHITPQGEKPDA